MGGSHRSRQVSPSAGTDPGTGGVGGKAVPEGTAGRRSRASLVPSPVPGAPAQSGRLHSSVPPLSPCLPIPVPSPSHAGWPPRQAGAASPSLVPEGRPIHCRVQRSSGKGFIWNSESSQEVFPSSRSPWER